MTYKSVHDSEEQDLLQKAIDMKNEGKLNESLNFLLEFSSHRVDYLPALVLTGHVFWSLGRLQEAADSFKKGIGLAPKGARASLGLFHCLWELGKQEEAMEEAFRFTRLTDSDEYKEIIRDYQSSE